MSMNELEPYDSFAVALAQTTPSIPPLAVPPLAIGGSTVSGMELIEITATPVKAVPVRLVGVEYMIKPPKGSLAIILGKKMQAASDNPDGMLRALNDWIVIGFGKTDAKAVMKRLEDPQDDLDFSHIMELMQKIAEVTTGNPTS
jgi:hypothetical protein